MTNPNMHTEGVDPKTGEVSGLAIATYYNPCTGVADADGYLRVFQDGEGHDYETRIDKATLIAMGWAPPSQS